ncbi:replication initiator [Streptomyces sp. GC420]|uniref:replication initiator n=1 Tax=Streptomyces sp. GC420 TaxID=2697568 RepID=UPI0028BDFBE7|nr:replication initiator [Streptomyces sp. GC420]
MPYIPAVRALRGHPTARTSHHAPARPRGDPQQPFSGHHFLDPHRGQMRQQRRQQDLTHHQPAPQLTRHQRPKDPQHPHENLVRTHFSTKSRAYSVTLGALRQERADHNEAQARERAAEAGHPLPDPDTVLVLAHWRFAGTGLTAAEHLLAHGAPPPGTEPDTTETEGDSAWNADETN